MAAVRESREAQISAVAALDEPTCRWLYDYVVHQPEPVSRDDAAAALELPRTTAAFHLDRLVDEGLLDVVYQLGKELGDTARSTAGDRDTRGTALRVLQEHDLEPRIEGDDITLANCPFHTLAQEYTELVCGMNLRLLDGLLDGLAPTGLTAHLDPAPPHCCVRLQPAAPEDAGPDRLSCAETPTCESVTLTGLIADQLQRTTVGGRRVGEPAELMQQIGPRGV